MTEHNYSQFCDLLIGGKLVGTQMVYLVFAPNGTISNADDIRFQLPSTMKGVPVFRILNTEIVSSTPVDEFRGGDIICMRAGDLTIYTEPTDRVLPS